MKRNKTPGLQFLIVFAFLLLLLPFASCIDRKPIAKLQPTIILISIDGFRYDYLAKYEPPILGSLAREGVQAKWMTPSFPTKTFPNHYAIVTGLYPQNNGIVENSVYDTATKTTFGMDNRAEVQNSNWWLGEPIWVTAEKQGQRAAPFFWPGSEAEIAGKRATYWMPYDGTFPNDARVDQVLRWLDLPPTERPTFLTLYFADVDHAGHEFTPDAIETRDAVLKVDAQFGRLIDGLKARNLFEQVNLIVVSDHGMATQDPHNTIILDEAFDTNLAEKVVWTSEIVSIFPKEGSEDAIYNSLKTKLPPQAQVYRKSQTPARLHYSNSPRIAPLLVLPDEGWVLMTRKRFEERKAKGDLNLRGGHGYDNELSSMRATFIARGPAFKKGAVIDPFENIQIYNVMAKILGLAPAPNDGDDTLIESALAEPQTGSYRP